MNYNTIEGAYQLFNSVNCLGQNNCIFLARININAGAVGGLLGGIVAQMDADEKYKCDAFLINQTERGIALIPLVSSTGLSVSIKNLQPNLQGTVFIDQSYVQNVVIKRAFFISAVNKVVKITLTTGFVYDLIVYTNEKNLPYQKSEFARFVSMYKR